MNNKTENCCEESTTDCCATDTNSCGCGETNTSNVECSHCNEKGIKVSAVTLKAQLKKEHFEKLNHSADDFHFCTNANCDTVYYSSDGTETYVQEDVKSKVACKNEDLKTPLCYCKKLLKKDVLQMIEEQQENIPSKIKAIITEGKTFCEKSNPRGTCCTQDIDTFLAKHGIDWSAQEKSRQSTSCAC